MKKNLELISYIFVILAAIIATTQLYTRCAPNFYGPEFIYVRAKRLFGFPHFVHVMEYAYYFTDILLHHRNSDKTVVVEVPKAKYHSPYVDAFLHKLNERVKFSFVKCGNVQATNVMTHDLTLLHLPFIFADNSEVYGDYQRWFQYKDTHTVLRDLFVRPNIPQHELTIGLVNRKPASGRHLLNADELCLMIEEELGIRVTQTFFEETTFDYQIQFFRNHQVMIGPHGAHLANIPFLPDNALILECCDEWQPYEYFTGLAYTCDKYHVDIRPSHETLFKGKQTNTKQNIRCDCSKVIQSIRDYIDGGNHLRSKYAYLK